MKLEMAPGTETKGTVAMLGGCTAQWWSKKSLWLCNFVISTRQKMGKRYPPNHCCVGCNASRESRSKPYFFNRDTSFQAGNHHILYRKLRGRGWFSTSTDLDRQCRKALAVWCFSCWHPTRLVQWSSFVSSPKVVKTNNRSLPLLGIYADNGMVGYKQLPLANSAERQYIVCLCDLQSVTVLPNQQNERHTGAERNGSEVHARRHQTGKEGTSAREVTSIPSVLISPVSSS